VFAQLPPVQLAVLVALCLTMLGLVLASAFAIGRLGGFSQGSRYAILFCGSVKSIASGAPMAKVLFPASAVAPVLLPVMLYHTLQLLVCASIAGAIARRRAKSPLPEGERVG